MSTPPKPAFVPMHIYQTGKSISMTVELVLVTKDGGPLTKQIWLDRHGKKRVDSSNCYMASGKAERLRLRTAKQLADLIDSIGSSEALCLGTLYEQYNNLVTVTTKKKLNGAFDSNVITRSLECI